MTNGPPDDASDGPLPKGLNYWMVALTVRAVCLPK
jgi:hypothetical protein